MANVIVSGVPLGRIGNEQPKISVPASFAVHTLPETPLFAERLVVEATAPSKSASGRTRADAVPAVYPGALAVNVTVPACPSNPSITKNALDAPPARPREGPAVTS